MEVYADAADEGERLVGATALLGEKFYVSALAALPVAAQNGQITVSVPPEWRISLPLVVRDYRPPVGKPMLYLPLVLRGP